MPSETSKKTTESFIPHHCKAAYVINCTSPDITCAGNQISQIKDVEATKNDLKRLGNVFERLQFDDFDLKYGKFDLNMYFTTLHFRQLRSIVGKFTH